MAHELAKSEATGQYRMAFRQRDGKGIPWHQAWTNCKAWHADPDLATVLHDLEAYIDVVLRPIFDQDGNRIQEVQETWRPYCDVTGTPILDSDGRVRGHRLGLVGPNYTIIQDHEVINWFKPWVESGLATIETGGAIFNGSRFWVLARLNQDPMEVVKGDPIEQYVLAFNGHDGKVSFKAFPTDVRVVCNNTVNMALKSKLSNKYKARHNRLVHEKVESLREDIEVMHLAFLNTIDKFKTLAKTNVKSEDELKTYFQQVLQEKVDPDKEVRADGKRPLHVLMRLFEEGVGNDMPGVKGTYWAAYNAVSEAVTHLRARNSDTRLDNMIMGTSQQMLSLALDLGLQAAVV